MCLQWPAAATSHRPKRGPLIERHLCSGYRCHASASFGEPDAFCEGHDAPGFLRRFLPFIWSLARVLLCDKIDTGLLWCEAKWSPAHRSEEWIIITVNNILKAIQEFSLPFSFFLVPFQKFSSGRRNMNKIKTRDEQLTQLTGKSVKSCASWESFQGTRRAMLR